MKIKVKASCSECRFQKEVNLEYEQEEIKCLACGHTLPNFSESELNEMEVTLKKQRTSNIIAIICFAITITGFVFFVLTGLTIEAETNAWVSGVELNEDGQNQEMASLIITSIGLLCTFIFGILGARKRYVIEF